MRVDRVFFHANNVFSLQYSGQSLYTEAYYILLQRPCLMALINLQCSAESFFV